MTARNANYHNYHQGRMRQPLVQTACAATARRTQRRLERVMDCGTVQQPSTIHSETMTTKCSQTSEAASVTCTYIRARMCGQQYPGQQSTVVQQQQLPHGTGGHRVPHTRRSAATAAVNTHIEITATWLTHIPATPFTLSPSTCHKAPMQHDSPWGCFQDEQACVLVYTHVGRCQATIVLWLTITRQHDEPQKQGQRTPTTLAHFAWRKIHSYNSCRQDSCDSGCCM